MTDGDDENNVMEKALRAVTDGPLYIAHELRLMANAESPYARFTYMTPMIKNIWRAAADLLDEAHMGARH